MTNAAKFLEVKRTALIQENLLRKNYVYESSKLHNLKDRTFYNWLDFIELVHTNVLRSSGSTIGELWKNVKNYVHSTGSTAAFTQPIMEYLKNSFQFEIVCADSCAKMYVVFERWCLSFRHNRMCYCICAAPQTDTLYLVISRKATLE